MDVACLLMVKNEGGDRDCALLRTLRSLPLGLDHLCVLDTGSTDNTLPLVRGFCEANRLHGWVREEPFVDFATSRNQLLAFAREELPRHISTFLLLDAGDVIQGIVPSADEWKKAYLVPQKWADVNGVTLFENVRLLHRYTPAVYEGVVHEILVLPAEIIPEPVQGLVLFQDRALEEDKSRRRYAHDVELLLKAPPSPRNQFYLARSYHALGETEKAIQAYLARIHSGGWSEELYQSYMALGHLQWKAGSRWLALQAYETAGQLDPHCAEPFVCLAEIWMAIASEQAEPKKRNEALNHVYQLAVYACGRPRPKRALFLCETVYTFRRWYLLAIICRLQGNNAEASQALSQVSGNLTEAQQTAILEEKKRLNLI